MSRRLLEAGKTLLIILLLVSAVFFAGKTGLYKDIKDSLPFIEDVKHWLTGSSGSSNESGVAFKEASVPLYVAVTGLGGQHYGIKHDGKTLKYFYERTGSILGKALSSSLSPYAITEEVWRKALVSPGIFYDYANPVPIVTLSNWFGANARVFNSGDKVRRICLSGTEKGGVLLYYFNETDSKYYRLDTSVPYSTLSAHMGDIPNGAKFAFELSEINEAYAKVDPYTLLLHTSSVASEVTTQNPFYGIISQANILSMFKVNLRLSFHYSESENTEVFDEERYSLRLQASGVATYRSSRSPGNRLNLTYSGAAPSISEMLDSARSLAISTVGSSRGDAEVLFTAFTEAENVYTFNFDYYVNGIAVHLPFGQHAATVKISGEYIIEANLVFRSFKISSGLQKTLPELQAAVLVKNDGGEPTLGYYDDGKGNLVAEWTEK